MAPASPPSFADTLTQAVRMEFYAQHKAIAVAIIVIVFVLPFVGVAVWGLRGTALAVVISALAYYLTPYAVVKLTDRDRQD